MKGIKRRQKGFVALLLAVVIGLLPSVSVWAATDFKYEWTPASNLETTDPNYVSSKIKITSSSSTDPVDKIDNADGGNGLNYDTFGATGEELTFYAEAKDNIIVPIGSWDGWTGNVASLNDKTRFGYANPAQGVNHNKFVPYQRSEMSNKEWTWSVSTVDNVQVATLSIPSAKGNQDNTIPKADAWHIELQYISGGLLDEIRFWQSVPVPYLEWNGTAFERKNCLDYTVLTPAVAAGALANGWYVCDGDDDDTPNVLEIGTRITVNTGDQPVVNIILCNGKNLEAEKGISVGSKGTLNIYAQEDTDTNLMGSLNAIGVDQGDYKAAGIGGDQDDCDSGEINIHGGNITAYGADFDNNKRGGAGIGGGYGADMTTDVANDYRNGNGGNITIHGGKVEAVGDYHSAGIGGNEFAHGGSVTITGGTVEAYGGEGAAGIGGGYEGNGGKDGTTKVKISGGKVTAEGGNGAAGIGGGSGIEDIKIVDGDNIPYYKGGKGVNVEVTGGEVITIGGNKVQNGDVQPSEGYGIGRGGIFKDENIDNHADIDHADEPASNNLTIGSGYGLFAGKTASTKGWESGPTNDYRGDRYQYMDIIKYNQGGQTGGGGSSDPIVTPTPTPVVDYTITYAPNNELETNKPITETTKEKEITLPQCTFQPRPGQMFVGWQEANLAKDPVEGTGDIYKPGDKFKVNKSVTLLAIWQDNPTFRMDCPDEYELMPPENTPEALEALIRESLKITYYKDGIDPTNPQTNDKEIIDADPEPSPTPSPTPIPERVIFDDGSHIPAEDLEITVSDPKLFRKVGSFSATLTYKGLYNRTLEKPIKVTILDPNVATFGTLVIDDINDLGPVTITYPNSIPFHGSKWTKVKSLVSVECDKAKINVNTVDNTELGKLNAGEKGKLTELKIKIPTKGNDFKEKKAHKLTKKLNNHIKKKLPLDINIHPLIVMPEMFADANVKDGKIKSVSILLPDKTKVMIKSDSFTVDEEKQVVTFSGNYGGNLTFEELGMTPTPVPNK